MRIEVSLRSVGLTDVVGAARTLEQTGVTGVCDTENRRDPLLTMALAAGATARIGLSTAVTIAFARSPMVTAYAARNLQDVSGGRFRLGLGTQVRQHVEHRFSASFDPPGPRLRDHVAAMRSIWRAWQARERLEHDGPYYRFDLMTPEFDPGPSPCPPVPIDLAAVGPYNLELAGEVADGVRLHPFSTPGYIRDVVWPHLLAGASRAGRDLAGFQVIGGGFVATGADAEEVSRARAAARARIGFYGSTRAYLPVLGHHGWGALRDDLRALVRAERWDDLGSAVPDEVLDAFCLTAPYPELPAALHERLGGLVDCVQVPCPDLSSLEASGLSAACRAADDLPVVTSPR